MHAVDLRQIPLFDVAHMVMKKFKEGLVYLGLVQGLIWWPRTQDWADFDLDVPFILPRFPADSAKIPSA